MAAAVIVTSPAGPPTPECPIWLQANEAIVAYTQQFIDWQAAPADAAGAAHRPSAWGAGPGRAPPYVRIMAMYMSCAVAPTRSTRSARYEKTYRAPQRTYHL